MGDQLLDDGALKRKFTSLLKTTRATTLVLQMHCPSYCGSLPGIKKISHRHLLLVVHPLFFVSVPGALLHPLHRERSTTLLL